MLKLFEVKASWNKFKNRSISMKIKTKIRHKHLCKNQIWANGALLTRLVCIKFIHIRFWPCNIYEFRNSDDTWYGLIELTVDWPIMSVAKSYKNYYLFLFIGLLSFNCISLFKLFKSLFIYKVATLNSSQVIKLQSKVSYS